jgi:hypothetical protein
VRIAGCCRAGAAVIILAEPLGGEKRKAHPKVYLVLCTGAKPIVLRQFSLFFRPLFVSFFLFLVLLLIGFSLRSQSIAILLATTRNRGRGIRKNFDRGVEASAGRPCAACVKSTARVPFRGQAMLQRKSWQQPICEPGAGKYRQNAAH